MLLEVTLSINVVIYVCIQPGHLAKNCRASYREQENRGSTTNKTDKSNARQITVTAALMIEDSLNSIEKWT